MSAHAFEGLGREVMSLSVADYLLGSESDKAREPESGAGAPSWPEPDAAAAGAAAKTAAGRGARSAAALEFAELTRLLSEATREWSQVEKAIEELRAALAPARFPDALTAAGIEPPRSAPGRDKDRAGRAGAGSDPRRAAAPRPRATDTPATPYRTASRAPQARGARPEPAAAASHREAAPRASRPEPAAAARLQDKVPPAAARAPATPPAKPTAGPLADGAVHAKLEQVLKLLRESLAERGGGTNTIPPEVSQKLAHAIAREVAGQVKESVISSLPRQGGAPREGDAGGGDAAEAGKADEETKRIPLGDVAAIIDQLIKRR